MVGIPCFPVPLSIQKWLIFLTDGIFNGKYRTQHPMIPKVRWLEPRQKAKVERIWGHKENKNSPLHILNSLWGKRGKKGWRNTNQGGGFSKINQNTESKICGCQRREWEENGHNHATSLKITCWTGRHFTREKSRISQVHFQCCLTLGIFKDLLSWARQLFLYH